MTLFLTVPELEAGIDQAESVFTKTQTIDEKQQIQNLLDILNPMLAFAETNVKDLLNIMGYNSIDDLNNHLQAYQETNLSLTEIFPAFSAPMLSSILAAHGIGTTNNDGIGLLVSAIEDRIRSNFGNYVDETFLRTDMQGELREKLNQDNMIEKLAIETTAQLFGGLDLNATGILDFMRGGEINWGSTLNRLVSAINQNAKKIDISGTKISAIQPFIQHLIIPFLQSKLDANTDFFINENSYALFEQDINNYLNSIKDKSLRSRLKDSLKSRVKRGGITVDTKIKSQAQGTSVISYLDALKVNVDPNLFDLETRGKDTSIEKYVNDICAEHDDIRTIIIKNIKQVYWDNIISHLPSGIENPIDYNKFSSIIEEMAAPAPAGNIGWFFSQGTTKAGGAGMFGEIISMIYMAILCPKLAAEWAGGTQSDSKVKPPADILLRNMGKKYGIQVKNYTSGETLTHDYTLPIKNMLLTAAAETEQKDLMSKQILNELNTSGIMKISEEEIEEVQNIIIAKAFNVPYKYNEAKSKFEQVPERAGFTAAQAKLNVAFLRATRYMAIASVIMHRLQYQEEVSRYVTTSKFEKNQTQNTLWLINGAYFVSSVQILTELKSYIENIMTSYFALKVDEYGNRYLSDLNSGFFRTSASTYLSGTKNNPLPSGLSEGSFTIVEYFNTSKDLQKTSLSYISGKIRTSYNMSSFHH